MGIYSGENKAEVTLWLIAIILMVITTFVSLIATAMVFTMSVAIAYVIQQIKLRISRKKAQNKD